MSHYLVPWSGGLDSTYLVWHLLSCGHSVDTVYFSLGNNSAKTTRELKARDKIKKYFSSFSKFKDREKMFNIDVDDTSRCYSDLAQVPAWITGIVYSCGNNKESFPLSTSGNHSYDYVALGYVMGDHAISFIEDIKKIYMAFGGLSAERQKLPKLVFPLKKMLKEDICNKLPNDILKEVTFCEERIDNCGKCAPCKRWKALEVDGYIPWNIRRMKEELTKECECLSIEEPIEDFPLDEDNDDLEIEKDVAKIMELEKEIKNEEISFALLKRSEDNVKPMTRAVMSYEL